MSPPPALPASLASLLPKVGERLEEVAPEQGADFAAAFGFALSRLGERDDPRPLMLTAPQAWLSERGRPFAQGLAIDPSRLFLVAAAKESQALWALEEALKSGAVAGGMALAGQASFVMTRRLDFAAKSGCCAAILLRPSPPVDLSAAHLRWRIGSLISASDPDDPRAPGAACWRADLVRRRDGPPASFVVEQDDETHRLRLAAGLAGDGLVQDSRAVIAA